MQHLYELNKGDLFTMEGENGMKGVLILKEKGHGLYKATRVGDNGMIYVSKYKLVTKK